MIARIRSFLPAANDYRGLRRSWRADLVAGLTVGIVALPLALAFGVSSGAGAGAGLITAIVAGVVAAVFGGSNLQVSGPTGAMVVVLAPIIAHQGIGALAPVCILAGGILVVAGTARLGRVVALIPWPVIEGFTLGIAVIIFLQQVPTVVGVAPGGSSNAAVAAVEAMTRIDSSTAIWTIGIAVSVAAIMLVAPRIHRHLPGSILAVVVVTAAAVLLQAPVARIGVVPSALPAPALPSVDPSSLPTLLGAAATVAALAGIESLLSARVASTLSTAGDYLPDRELLGQGLASIASGLFGGMPATGAIARTAVNARSGARTRMAAIVHSLVLLVIVYAASTVVSVIPLAVLAGVLMVTAVTMIPVPAIRAIFRSSRADALVFTVTALVTVSVDLIYAVLIGFAIAALFALRNLAGSGGVHREVLEGPVRAGDERIAVFRIEGALFFGTAEKVVQTINDVHDISVVILRLSRMQLLDSTGAHTLAELVRDLERRGVTVLVKGVRPEHLPLTTRLGVVTALRHPNHLFDDLPAAVAHARSHVVATSLAKPASAS
nr:SulP family inorganic anion transporter [Herbiconiux ginsengi]